MTVKLILYVIIGAIVVIDFILLIKLMEYAACVLIRHQPPLVPSNHRLRMAAIKEIKNHCATARRICEIGSGYGGFARQIARRTPNAQVYGLENMPVSAMVSKIGDMFTPNCRTVWTDAFDYIEKNAPFDIAVAYLGPRATECVGVHRDKFKVLVSLCFPLANIKPTKVIDVDGGYTIYNRKKYPHRIYVYHF